MGLAKLLVAASAVAAGAAMALPTGDISSLLQARGVNVTDLDQNVASTSLKGCLNLTTALRREWPNQTLIYSETAFSNWTASFWSQQQEEIVPQLIFQPTSALEVSSALLLAELFSCPFAVKSGGHAAFSGASSIQGGFNIDLSGLNTITLNKGQTVASIGTGNRWVDVYGYLETYGLAVIGGRVSTIGVGGLTTGGGISFFSQEYGWACDNVVNYEVVLASGEIADVNQTSYPDLYWALRGGGNNFGIVTRFDLSTHTQGSLWSGSLIYLPEYSDQALDAFYYYGINAGSDPKSAVIMNWAYDAGEFLAVADLEYADSTINPPIFQNFTNITAYENTMEVRNLTAVTDMFQASNPDGLRESYWTATFSLTQEMIAYCVQVFETETVLAANATGYLPALVLQIITTDMTTQMQKNGGNALGLSPEDGNLLLLNLSFMWGDIADDNLILDILGTIVSKTIAYAKANGLYNEYLYMNYASQYQAVIPSYGAENFAKLKNISEKYDPHQIFQTLEPGYFKLSTEPPNSTYPSS